MKQIAIYGAGGFAREVAWLVESCNAESKAYNVVCFIDDNEATHGTLINGIPSMGLEEVCHRFPEARVVGGVGNPRTRQRLMEKAAAAGLGFETIIHPRTELSQLIDVGIGTVICAGNILTVNITLGQHVQINLDCTIGHNAVIGDYTTLAPGVHISGWVQIGQRVYIGTGAVIIDATHKEIVIGDDAVIGAGACVTKSVSAGTTVVGVPAKPLQHS
jgi:sugar O-acyltransferase (sialic acid O-acetyltransferase NeuD family)